MTKKSATRTISVNHVILGAKTAKPPFYFRCRKGLWTPASVDNFIVEQEKKSHITKTQRDIKRLQTF